MTRRFPRYPRRLRQAGVGLVTAIFLLVVLAGLAVAMVSVYTAQQASSNLDLQGARAYQAARAGLEWGLFRQLRTNPKDGCINGATFGMPAGTSLSGFTVVVSCTQSGLAGGLLQVTLASTACNIADSNGCTPSANPESVRRTVETQVTQPPPPTPAAPPGDQP
jgi:MSHA biogenesis protein MshP